MQASRFRGGLDRRKHGVGDESNQRGDTVHLDTIVKRVSAFCRKSIADAGLRSTLIARGWKFFTSTSTLHFSRQHPSEHFDRAFGNRQTQDRHHRVRQRNSRQRCGHPRSYTRTPACAATDGPQVSMRSCGGFLDACTFDFWDRSSNLFMDTSTYPKQLSCRWRPRHGRPSRPSAITLSLSPGSP